MITVLSFGTALITSALPAYAHGGHGEFEAENETEQEIGMDDDEIVNPSSSVTQSEAIAIAQAVFSGTVDRVEQEFEDGVLVWKVRLNASNGEEADVIIDAETGEILRVKM